MVARRLDRRVAARVGASDIVQEALIDAERKLDDYLRERPLPFYPWLHRLASERLAQTHRRHFGPSRDLARERVVSLGPACDLSVVLANRLVDSGSSPSGRLLREEANERVLVALSGLAHHDREILRKRYLDGMPFAEVAVVLGLSEGAVKMRHLRALERLKQRLDESEKPSVP